MDIIPQYRLAIPLHSEKYLIYTTYKDMLILRAQINELKTDPFP